MRRVALVVLGAYVGVLGAFVHRHGTRLGELPVPWGLALAIVTAYLVARAAATVVRLGDAYVGLGWSLALLAQQVWPDDGFLVASDPLGWAFTIGGLGAIVVAVLRESRLKP